MVASRSETHPSELAQELFTLCICNRGFIDIGAMRRVFLPGSRYDLRSRRILGRFSAREDTGWTRPRIAFPFGEGCE